MTVSMVAGGFLFTYYKEKYCLKHRVTITVGSKFIKSVVDSALSSFACFLLRL